MASTVAMQEKFSNVRKKLDQLGYRQPLSLDSLPLVERILSDLVWTTESLRKTKSDLDKRMEVRGKVEECIEPYKTDNAKFVKENNDLHQRIVTLKQNHDEALRDLKADLRKVQAENEDLKFFNTQCLSKIKTFEKDSKAMAEKILQLQEKNFQAVVHTPGGRKKSIPFRRQRMDIDALVPPSGDVPKEGEYCCLVARQWKETEGVLKDQGNVDIMRVATQRCEDMSVEVARLQEEIELRQRKVDNFRKQVELRDTEMARLTRMMEGGRSLEAVSADSQQEANQRLVTQLNLQVEMLQQKNDELERQVTSLRGKIAAQRRTHLDRVVVEKPLEDRESRWGDTRTSEKDAGPADTDRERAPSREDIGLMEDDDRLRTDSADSKRISFSDQVDNREVQEIIDRLQEDKLRLSQRVEKLTDSERELVLEIERVNRHAAGSGSGMNKGSQVESYLRGVEEDRDYWRGEAELLAKMIRADKGGKKMKPVQHGKKGATGNKKEKAHDNQLHLLEDERDFYKREYAQMKATMHQSGGRQRSSSLSRSSPTRERHASGDDHSVELKRLRLERDSLQNLLDKFERQLQDIQGNVRVLTQERDSINKLYEETRSELHRVRQELVASPKSAKVSLAAQAVLRRVESERDDILADLRRMTTERDSLRERLRSSTETALSDKARLEQKLEDAQLTARKATTEREDTAGRISSLRQRLADAEEQTKILSTQALDKSDSLEKERSSASQTKMQLDACQRQLEQSERRATQKDSELHEAEDRLRIVQDRLTTLERELKSQREECARLRSTVSQLDHEKDSLQGSVDERAERVSQMEHDLHVREQQLAEVRGQLAGAEAQLTRAQEGYTSRDRDLRALVTQVEQMQGELNQERRRSDHMARENARLQDDLTTMTRETQALQGELQETAEERESVRGKAQDYVQEVRRAEELLAQKEQERTSLLEQYRLLSLEAERYQTAAHQLEGELSNMRMESMARDQELKRLRERLDSADADGDEQQQALRSYELQVSSLTRSVSELEEQIRFHQSEKEDLLGDVSAIRDLCARLEASKESIQRQLTSASLELEQLRGRVDDLGQENTSLRDQLTEEEGNLRNLETVLSSSREKEFQSQLDAQERQAELGMLKDRLDLNDTKLEQQSREISRLRTRNTELETEVEQLHRQLTGERFDKERAQQELRRFQQRGSPGWTGAAGNPPGAPPRDFRSPSAHSPHPDTGGDQHHYS